MHGLESIAHIGQSATDNHAHRIVQVGACHLIDDAYWLDNAKFHEITDLPTTDGKSTALVRYSDLFFRRDGKMDTLKCSKYQHMHVFNEGRSWLVLAFSKQCANTER